MSKDIDAQGQYLASVISVATDFPTSTQYGDLTSITLPPGDWDVTGVVNANQNGATFLNFQAGVSVTGGNSSTGLLLGDTSASMFGPQTGVAGNVTAGVYNVRFSFLVATPIFLKYFGNYSVATPNATGRLSARRWR